MLSLRSPYCRATGKLQPSIIENNVPTGVRDLSKYLLTEFKPLSEYGTGGRGHMNSHIVPVSSECEHASMTDLSRS